MLELLLLLVLSWTTTGPLADSRRPHPAAVSPVGVKCWMLLLLRAGWLAGWLLLPAAALRIFLPCSSPLTSQISSREGNRGGGRGRQRAENFLTS
ncbi:hypothetical protein Mapa_003152 [Marchantia paleacea]|nr:hypothetical protein Mapa_003152 [Marchantia paleacea]